jgi:hypothetical protein
MDERNRRRRSLDVEQNRADALPGEADRHTPVSSGDVTGGK